MPYDNPDDYGAGNTPDQGPPQAPGAPTPPGPSQQEREAEAQRKLKEAAYKALQSAYKTHLKREGSESEYEGHLNGRYDQASVQRALQSVEFSPEAQRIRESGAVSPGQSGTPGQPGQPGTFTPREERDKLQWGNVGNLEGFQVGSDYGGDLKARNSVKNTFGRIASKYPATPEGLRQVVQDPEFRAAFPNARLIDHPTGDKIDFGGVLSDFETGSPVGVVDVGRSFSGASQKDQTAWVWQPEGTSSASYNATQRAILNPNDPALQGGVTREPGADVRAAVLGNDPYAAYIEYLRQLQAQGLSPGGSTNISPESPLFF